MASKLLFEDETYKIRKSIFEVYKYIGCGFLEAVYQECLEKEFGFQNIPYVPQKRLTLKYKGEPLKKEYIPDFVCYDKIIVELKAAQQLTERDQAQVINYLRASDMAIGLLVNFGAHPKVDIIRLVNF